MAAETLARGRRPDFCEGRLGVFTQGGGAARSRTGGAAQAGWRARLFHPAVGRVVDLDDHSTGDGVLVDQPFVDRFAGGAGAAGLGDGILPLLGGLFPEEVLHPFAPHFDGVGTHLGPVQVFEVFDPFGPARGLEELAGEALVHAVILDVAAIGALVLVGHDVAGQLEQVGRVDFVEPGQVATHGGEHGAVQGDLDTLALAGALAGDESHGYGDGADDGGEGAGGGQRQKDGIVLAPHALVGAGGGTDDGLPALLVTVGAVLAEPGKGAVD